MSAPAGTRPLTGNPEPQKEDDDAQTTPEPAAADAETSNERAYIILRALGGPNAGWSVVKTVTATNKQTALRSLGESGLENGAKYRVVPQRSWDPEITAAVETTTSIGFSES